MVMSFINAHCVETSIEPVCRELAIPRPPITSILLGLLTQAGAWHMCCPQVTSVRLVTILVVSDKTLESGIQQLIKCNWLISRNYV